MATSNTTWTILDHAGVPGYIGVHGLELTAANIATQATLRAALEAAIDAVTMGTIRKESVTASETTNNDPLPTSKEARKAKKWLIRARDTNGNAVTVKLPTADPTFTSTGSNTMDLTTTEGAALLAAFEAYARSNDGEAVVIEEVVFVDK